LSNSDPGADYLVKAGQTGRRPIQEKEKIMPHYLVTGYLPENFDPSTVTQTMIRDMGVLNDEMEAAGVRVLGLGLSPASGAKSLRAQPNGKVLVTDGPYMETKEHVGGFLVLKAANMDEALGWARRGVFAGGAEVREILRYNE
jgi:hypothetical protein